LNTIIDLLETQILKMNKTSCYLTVKLRCYLVIVPAVQFKKCSKSQRQNSRKCSLHRFPSSFPLKRTKLKELEAWKPINVKFLINWPLLFLFFYFNYMKCNIVVKLGKNIFQETKFIGYKGRHYPKWMNPKELKSN
jgi:hypothetical protein